MKKLIFIFVFILISSNCLAYEGSPESQASQFMNELLSGKTNEAIDNLYSSNPAMGQKIQQLNVMKQQVAMVANLFGKAIGVEDYIVEQITPSITRVVKIMKYDVHPVVWEFYFYKPHDKWVASNSIFNDQFGSLNSKK